MKTKTLTAIAVLCSFLFMEACRCPRTHVQEAGGVGPQPGGDLVINLNPSGGGYGPVFAVGYVHGGNESTLGGVIHHEIEIASNADDTMVGLVGGTRATLTEDQEYAVDITNLEGPTVTIKNKNNPSETHTVSVNHGSNGDYKSPIFSVVARKHQTGGVNYTRIAIVKGDKFVYFDVNH